MKSTLTVSMVVLLFMIVRTANSPASLTVYCTGAKPTSTGGAAGTRNITQYRDTLAHIN